MLNDFSCRVGAKIRTYRKAQNLSLDQLSSRISKSKATISKYESGGISIDIMTLYEVSQALHVDIKKLVEVDQSSLDTHPLKTDNGVELPSMLYLYHSHHLKYYTSFLYLNTEDDGKKITATLYYKAVSSPGDYIKCTNIYHGDVTFSDGNLDFIFSNFSSRRDMVYMQFFIPIHITEFYPGLCLGVQNTNMRPVCFRAMLSPRPLTKKSLEKNLLLSRNFQRKLKNGSYYSIEEHME